MPSFEEGIWRVSVVLTEQGLYCANEGAPVDVDGITAILSAYLSQKRGAQIGHFGLGFKSGAERHDDSPVLLSHRLLRIRQGAVPRANPRCRARRRSGPRFAACARHGCHHRGSLRSGFRRQADGVGHDGSPVAPQSRRLLMAER